MGWAVKLTELLSSIGDDHLEFQVLSKSTLELRRSNRGKVSRVTFGTEESAVNGVLDGTREAIIVWVDSKKLEAAREALASQTAEAP